MSVQMPSTEDTEFDPFAGPAVLAAAPSTEPQREVWTAAQMGSDASLAFNESVTMRMRGAVDLEQLHASFAELVGRHEALRTTFDQDGLTLLVSDVESVALVHDDLAALEPDAREARFQALLREELTTPFALALGPLSRVRYVRVAEQELRVVLTAHHIICDGWSTAVLLKEWAALYNARRAGRGADLAPAPRFTVYARAEQEAAESEARLADEQYWLGRFTGQIPVLELPYDRPRPPTKTYSSRRCDHELDAVLVAAVKKVGSKQRSSLFNTLLAAFQALLFRLSGQEDLVVGIPAAGQSVGGHAGLVGHCVNMLPLRIQLAADTPMSELLARVRTHMLDAYEHQRYTFGTLLSKLPITRDPSRLPLVSVVFNVDRGLTSEAIGFVDIETALAANPRHSENFDLFVNAVELPSGVTIECQFNTDLFDESTVRRWLQAYEKLLRALVAQPDVTVGDLDLVSEQELALYQDWNDATSAPLPFEELVHELFEQACARQPEATACVFEGQTVSYRELNERADALAQRLRASGIRGGALVGLCVERSIDLLAALLGILKAGGAYVPLDPGYPIERLTFMVQDAQITTLVTQRSVYRELGLLASSVVFVDEPPDPAAAPAPHEAGTASWVGAVPTSPAYVIYTSGSTGRPKGVLVSHRSAVNLLHSVSKTPGMEATDVVLAVTTVAFDIALSELILPLTVGAKIVLVTREVASDGARLLDAMTMHSVTFIDATPATYRMLLAAGFAGHGGLTAICTGEAMPRDLASTLVDLVGRLWNGYGPTETTVWSTFYRVCAPVDRILIGRPVDNTQIHILDRAGRPTLLGVPGEICIGGLGVALGYLGRPDLTAERFVRDSFGTSSDARMYRTGDLGRYLPSGELECLGRNDNQVKLRGYRIELGEIENALGQHASVQQAAVIVREDEPGDARLVAYAVLSAGALESELRTHLKRTLPDYMVPATYVFLQTMPLTPSGKVDRRALPQPDLSARAPSADFVAAGTPTEELLAALWQEALRVPRVSTQDDFFSLGGHSLLASQILARLRRDHQIQLSFRTLFESPTIAQLASVIDAQQREPAHAELVLLQRGDERAPAPLSVAQERLWMLEQMDPSQELVHNLPAAWRLEGEVDPELLQRALDRVVERHATFRTTIEVRAGRPWQVIAPRGQLRVEQVDLEAYPAAQREARMHELIASATGERFDLTRGPLFRSTLFRLSGREYVYFTLRHNAIWDGWSFDVFLRELAAVYGALESGVPEQLPELRVSYADYVRWQRGFLESAEMQKQVAWWRGQLAGDLPELVMPSDRPRPAASTHAGGNATLQLTRAEADALIALGRSTGATLFMVLFAAFNVMLHRHSGQSEILVGTPVRARNRPEVEDLIGPFVNAVVLRSKLSSSQTFVELLAQVRNTTLDSFSHEDMPLELLGTRPPIVRAFFSFQDASARPPSLGSIPVSQIHVEPPSAANDLMLWTMETRTGLLAALNYSTELFDVATIERFLGGFAELLRAVVKSPNASVAELPISEPRALIAARTLGAPRGGERTHCVWEWVEQRASESPDRRAISDGVQTLSYSDLRTRALGVAGQLVAGGLDHGAIVAIHTSSSVARLVLWLGAYAAGTASIVLDPSSPLERNRALCRAAAVQAVLGSSSEALPELAPALIYADEQREPLHALPSAPPEAALASWLYRFDAHSRPLLFPVSRAQLASSAAALAQTLEAAADDCIIGLSPACAELAVVESLCALAVGATLVAPPAGARLDTTAAPKQGAIIAGPAALLARLSTSELALARCVGIVGAAAPALVARLQSRDPLRVVRFSALAEAGAAPLAQASHDAGACILGRPLYPTRVAIVDDRGQLVGLGVPGSLRVANACPSVAQPDSGSDAVRGFDEALSFRATGLRALMREDGSLDLLASDDARVEFRGALIALEEIESALLQHPSVLAAVVALKVGKSGTAELVAFVQARRQADFTDSELRAHLRARLPDHMVPQQFTELDELPRRGDGRGDRQRLLARAQSDAEATFVSPRSGTEREMAELWQAMLGVARVGVHDNFFDLGGHSLLCFKMIAALEQRTGQRIGPRIVLLGTLEQVAAELDRSAVSQPPRAAPPKRVDAAPARPEGALASRLLQKLKGIVRG